MNVVVSVVLILVINVHLGFAELADPSGYSNWFKTNLDEVERKPLTFTKPIPKWINGTLIRVGAGRFEMGNRKATHIADGFGKLLSFEFYGNGSATFSTKFMYTEYYNKSIAINDFAPYMQMDVLNPPFNELQIVEALFHSMDNIAVNVYRLYNNKENKYEYMTVADMWKVYQFDHDLNTIGPVTPEVDMNKFKYVAAESTAHPLKEYGSDKLFTFLTGTSTLPNQKSQMTLYRMNTVAEREHVITWPIDESRYIHSFSVTKRYVVIVAPPITIDPTKLVQYGYVMPSFQWNKNSTNYVYVIDLKEMKVTTMKTAPFFFFHHVSAYEENDTIIVDICTFANSTTFTMFTLPILTNQTKRNSLKYDYGMVRLVIDLKTETVQQKSFQSSPKVPYSTHIDFPIINENYRYSKYCYVFGTAQRYDNKNFDKYAIVKKNVCDPSGDKSWTLNNNFPSETLFVPTPGSTREDDGILLSHVFDGIMRETNLYIINATTMETISKSLLPTIIPVAVHGRFFPAE